MKHDETRQIRRVAPDPVRDPRAHARTAELAESGVHEKLRRAVIDLVRRHSAKKAELVDDPGRVRKERAHRGARVAMALERSLRPHELGAAGIDERKPLAARETRGWSLPIQPLQCVLGLEELELTRATGHEEKDDVSGSRLPEDRVWREEMRERYRPETDARTTEKLTTRNRCIHRQLRLENSARLKRTRATADHARSSTTDGATSELL